MTTTYRTPMPFSDSLSVPIREMFKKVRPFTGTWFGRAGTSTEYLMTTSDLGPRVVVHRWHDTNEVTVRGITGDAWKGRRPFSEVYHATMPMFDAGTVNTHIAHARDSLIVELKLKQ